MNRRNFLKSTLAAAALPSIATAQEAKPRKKILLRSSWQTVNIGDIAHTPGMLRLLEEHLPDYDITLWPGSVDHGVAEMLMKRFPKLRIMDKTGAAKDEAFKTHDFLLHGSGPGIVGVTWDYSEEGLQVINGARFAFFRDSVSLALA